MALHLPIMGDEPLLRATEVAPDGRLPIAGRCRRTRNILTPDF